MKILIQDKFGDTPLHFAAREGWVEIWDYLIKKCPELLEITNQEGKNALTYALENSQTSAAQVMRNYGCKPSYGDRKAKILELAKKLMDEPPKYSLVGYSKSVLFNNSSTTENPTKIKLVGERLNRDLLEQKRKLQRSEAYKAKLKKESLLMKHEKDKNEDETAP